MKFSLITATLGRVSEFERLLQSLSAQTFKDFELIVVDQNDHFQLEEICNRFKNLNIKYIHSDKKGLSLNRNIGLKYAVGEIVGFPDDDCYYDNNLLEKVVEKFENFPDYKLVVVEWKDTITSNIMKGKTPNNKIRRNDLHKRCISFNFFISQKTNMQFDENLGVGARFGAGEETDFLWNYFMNEDYGIFADDTFVWHPHKEMTEINTKRSYNYALGYGAIMKKAFSVYKFRFVLFKFLFAIAKNIVGILFTRKRQHHIAALKGKIIGFYSYTKKQ